MVKKTSFLKNLLLPFGFFLFFVLLLGWPYFFKGMVPVPGDILIGHYFPWRDEIWGGRTAGYPVKNFILYDGIRQTLPWRMLAVEQIKSGILPLWNPYIFSGMPLLANLQAAVLYPLNFLFFVLPFFDAWSIYLFLQPLLAGIFTYFFVKSLKNSSAAALLAGVCYAFSSMMMNHFEFGIDGHTALWLPLSLLAINMINKTSEKKWGILLTFSIMMTLLGGYPPPAIYNLGIIFLYSLLKIRPVFSPKSALIIFGFLLGFGLSAIQILPSFELAQKVIRNKSEFGVGTENFFFPFENLIMLVAPDFFGHPSTGNFFSRIYQVDNPSIGIVGFIFVLYGLTTIFKKKESFFWFLAAFLPLFLMLDTFLGRFFGSIDFAFISLVTPMRMNWIIIFAFSVLAAIGLDKAVQLFRNSPKNFFVFIIPLLIAGEVVLMLWSGTIIFLNPSLAKIAQKNLLLPSFFFFLTVIVFLLMNKFPRKIFLLSFAFAAIAGFELVREGIKYNPFIFRELVFPQTEILSKITDGNVYRTIASHQEILPVNSNIAYKVSMIDGYASIYDGRYGQMVKIANYSYPVTRIENYPRIVFQTNTDSSIIDLLGVKYILSIKEINNPKLQLIAQGKKTKLYENRQVFPKAFLVDNYYQAKDDLEIINRMLEVDLRKEVVLEEEPVNFSFFKDKETPNPTDSLIEIVDFQDNKISLNVSTPKASILVLNDTYDPGWQATVDFVLSKVYRADYALKAIEIPPGNHRVVFSYYPDSLKKGISIFLVSIFFLFCYFMSGFGLKLPLFKKKSK